MTRTFQCCNTEKTIWIRIG